MSVPGLTWNQDEGLYFSGDHEPPMPIPALPEEEPQVIDPVRFDADFPNTQAYKDVIARIVGEVALAHGWRVVRVA